MSYPPFPRMSERKSRRTHKNSRDGCPNCKAKRIKCSEELPSCHNCIKKNYRCGYLDFPKEKLEHIKNKNEKRAKDQPDHVKHEEHQGTGPHLLPYQRPFVTTSHSNNLTSANSNNTQPNNINNTIPPPRDIFASLSPFNQNSYDNSDFFITRNDLRYALYKDTFHKLTNLDVNSSSESFGNEYSENLVNNNVGHGYNGQPATISDNDETDNLSSNSFENSQNVLTRHMKTVNRDADVKEIEEINPSEFHNIFHPYPPPSHPTSSPGTPLENARSHPIIINKLAKIKRLKNSYLSRYLKHYRSDFKKLANKEFFLPYTPIWTRKNSDLFWISVYNQSIIIKVYYSFFMDRALNVLLKVCNKAISAENSSTSFTKQDLDILTKKSYTYYGLLIRDLRESITEIHIEYPIKISLYAAWSTFLHSHATIETLCLVFTGTASLFNKIVNDSRSLNDITHTLQISLQSFNDHACTCLVPDYKFDVINELYQDLLEFKTFIINNQSITSPKNSLILKNFLELESFMKNLIVNFYPRIVYINSYYKLVNNIDDTTDDILFTSPTLFFELLVNWFDIFPSDVVSLGSHLRPLRKTFYLFFIAIGKALMNVFTPIRSMMMVDAVNVVCPFVDFDCEIYRFTVESVDSIEQYLYLDKITKKLLRVVSFFNNRIKLLGYHLSTRSVLSNPAQTYLTSVEPKHNPAEVHYQDIIRLKPAKIDFEEIMITDFDIESSIHFYNYPLLSNLQMEFDEHAGYSQAGLRKIVEDQQNLQQSRKSRVNSFNFETGMFDTDFDITEPLRYYHGSQSTHWSIKNWSMEDLNIRAANFDSSRREISRSVNHGHSTSSSSS
ncbi:uncharacterized protein RJT20DRAFT_95115 [Scheffersomyces xylosifermentans]|uniref:uncharacterized protein n=1 Tax=Scheffersomyces xylosifermentans TaxID=1304137 RepID=UPI00315CCB8A